MVHYRRNYEPGNYYFFTVVLYNRRSNLLIKHIKLLQQVIKSVKQQSPYQTIAAVIMHDHMHVIWKMPPNDSDYSSRWKKIKCRFTRKLKANGINLLKNSRGEYNVWQRRFWEHTISNEEDLEKCINYIHYNPVKHKLVKNVRDWPHSSFHEYVKRGLLDINWGEDLVIDVLDRFGE